MRRAAGLLIAICLGMLCAMPAMAAEPGRVLKDVVYGNDPAQRMDVYIPVNPPKNAPIIFMVHGGAWKHGDKDMSRVVENKSAHYLSQGYLFVSANYRMSDAVTPIDQATDLINAIITVQKQAGEWGGDASRMILMGHSAGAHLIGLISAAPPKYLAPIRGSVLLDSGALDLLPIMQNRHFRFYDAAFGKDENFWRLASPYHQMTGRTAPMLVVCSTRRQISCEQAEAFATKGKTLGNHIVVLKQDKSHGEINYDLGKPEPYTEEVDRFIESVLL